MIRFLTPLHWPFQRRLAPAGKRRALLRLIAIAIEERLDLAETVAVWAEESRGLWRTRLVQLAQTLGEGVSLSDAIERSPGLLSGEEILLIRFAHESGTLAPTLRRHVDASTASDPSDSLTGVWRQTQQIVVGLPLAFLAIQLVLLVILGPRYSLITATYGISSLPQIYDEFEISTPAAFDGLYGVSQWLFSLWFVALGITLVIGGALRLFDGPGLWLRRLGERLSPALRDRRVAGVFRRLSENAAAGRPATASLATLARWHDNPTIRHRLLESRNEVGLGVDAWSALHSAGLLTPAERDALAAADRVGVCGWTLSALADARDRRAAGRSLTFAWVVWAVVFGLFAFYVLASAWSVLSLLNGLTLSLV